MVASGHLSSLSDSLVPLPSTFRYPGQEWFSSCQIDCKNVSQVGGSCQDFQNHTYAGGTTEAKDWFPY